MKIQFQNRSPFVNNIPLDIYQSKNRKVPQRYYSFLLAIVLLTISTLAMAGNEITIDLKSKSLVSPHANFYQWYYFDQPLKEGVDRKLAINRSGFYTVKIIATDGNISTRSIWVEVTAATIRKIYIIGDSTVMTYGSSAYPQAGWGQILPFFLNTANVSIDNRAIGGRSSKSFYQEGRWTTVYNLLAAGDFVFIQFGHNDRDFTNTTRYADTATYKQYLRIYVNDTRAKGAFPVLVTPMILNAWNGTTLRNVFTEGANDYRGAMFQVANQLHVPLIDLNMKSYSLMKSLGKDYITNFLYLTLKAGEYPNFPNGNSDGTHFQEMGAIEMAKLVAQGINELSADANVGFLAQNLKPTYQVSTTSNNSSAGLITRSNTYPAGVNVTIKGFPAAGHTFVQWTDPSNAIITSNPKFSFAMGTTALSYKGYFDQANYPVTIQESTTGFCSVDGTIDSNNAGFTGTGFANTNNATAAGINWSATTPGGTYTVSWRYANGGGSDRPGRLLINGSIVTSSISFPATTNWTTWTTVSTTVTLSSGIKTIRLEATGASGLVNIDHITLSGVNPQVASCPSVARMESTTQSNLEAIESQTTTIYPNPSEGAFNIKSKGDFQYTLYDQSGRQVESGKGQQTAIVGSSLTPGHYVVKVKSDTKTERIKIIKH